MIREFSFARSPRILFGAGSFRRLDAILAGYGRQVLLVCGARSLRASGRLDALRESLQAHGAKVHLVSVDGEPSPEKVDQAVSSHQGSGIACVAAVGGGSALDAGKAISAMLLQTGCVEDYLEGVGRAAHDGRKVPFVAVPTTAGTGSEATKNAVLSRPGPSGFKRSLRHERLVPDVAVVDPELLLECPADLSAACGMDALTQLLEGYVSAASSPLTDALAESGLAHLSAGLLPSCGAGARDLAARSHTAYAALLSGLVLASAGLGVIHGIAGPMGCAFPIPHGAACGTLAAALTAATVEKLLASQGASHPAARKYARAAALLSGDASATSGTAGERVEEGARRLVRILEEWTERLALPRLTRFGVHEKDLASLAAAAGNKNNPVPLSADEIRAALQRRL